MNRIDGKIAVITGSTSGIGEASAKLFAQAGAKVVVAGRNEVRGKRIVESIKQDGFEAVYVKLDVRSDESVTQFTDRVINQFGKIDILFNNAGIFPPTPSMEEMEMELWETIFDINSTGVYRVIKKMMPYLVQSKGVILNNASVAGMQSFASGKTYAYSASKAAVIQFSRMLAKNYGEFVRVNCICPGVVDTPIFLNRDFSRYTKLIPMGRVAMPEDIAKVANFLVSNDAEYINGAVIPIDGGQSL